MQAEGVKKVAVLTEDLERYPDGTLPAGIAAQDRAELDNVSKAFSETAGTTVIIYDQTCAAEKRRRRKRGLMADPDRRVVINPAVCEGCGDCSVQSNCVSVEPLETEFGRKRRINQSSCNKDFSCVKGFCPSFVSVSGAKVRKPAKGELSVPSLPEPQVPALNAPWNILVTGIGGTGVLTVSALLGMAGHVAGVASTTADMAGLAQKGGAVWSHVRLAPSNDTLLGPRIMTGTADLVLACDSVVAASDAAQKLMDASRTVTVANGDVAPTADFVRDRDLDFRTAQVKRAIEAASRRTLFVAAERVATALFGDAIAANMILMGHAWQSGLIPLSFEAIDEAIKLNGVAVAFNREAFAVGRWLAVDAAAVAQRAGLAPPPEKTLDERIAARIADLTAWGDAAYAQRFADKVATVRAAEAAVSPGSTALTEAAMISLYKLMSYKDEYEVARLHLDNLGPLLDATFAERAKLTFHLAPPLLSRIDPATGRPKKRDFPGWLVMPLFGVLKRMKGLRGTAFDPFGRSEERRAEREAVPAFEAELDRLLAGLTAANLGTAAAIARLPYDVRGFGPVKEAAAAKVAARRTALWARFDAPQERLAAAE
jgi:indolepyruvate ferredoxin oxidoreductase